LLSATAGMGRDEWAPSSGIILSNPPKSAFRINWAGGQICDL
jgi:hypothetical protein